MTTDQAMAGTLHGGQIERPLNVPHLGGPERLSRLEIGRILLRGAGLDPGLAREGSTRDHAGPPRTPDTSFDSTRAMSILRTPIRRIEEVA